MTRILLLCGAASALLSAGCATVPQHEARLDNSFILCDADYVARIEREAKRHGSAIRWYRCPQLIPTIPPFYFGEWRDA